MSNQKNRPPMDPRCPLKLGELPCAYCPLAVLRLKQLRNSDHELSEEEESKLSGCSWAVNSQSANFCFFVYAYKFLDGKPLSDVEIAHMNAVSVDTVKKTEKHAMDRFRNDERILDLKDWLEGESPIDAILDDSEDEYSVII